jgi:hypothetical protein
MNRIGTFVIGGLVLLMFSFVPTMASAIPMADVLYFEEDLGGGHWRYNYTVYNDSDPVVDVNVTLWTFYLDFDPGVTLLSGEVPGGWGYEYFPGEVGSTTSFVQSTSSDLLYEIMPGDSLAGFVFDFDARIGDIAFLAYLFDPKSAESVEYPGTTGAAPVPEPATFLLIMSGLAGIGMVGRKRIRKSKR